MDRDEKIRLGKQKFKSLKSKKKSSITDILAATRPIFPSRPNSPSLKDLMNQSEPTTRSKKEEADYALLELKKILDRSLSIASVSSNEKYSSSDTSPIENLRIKELEAVIERQKKEIEIYKKVIQGIDSLPTPLEEVNNASVEEFSIDPKLLNRAWSKQRKFQTKIKEPPDMATESITLSSIKSQPQMMSQQLQHTQISTIQKLAPILAKPTEAQAMMINDSGNKQKLTKDQNLQTSLPSLDVSISNTKQESLTKPISLDNNTVTLEKQIKIANEKTQSLSSIPETQKSIVGQNVQSNSASNMYSSLSLSSVSYAQKASSSTQTDGRLSFMKMTTIKALFNLQRLLSMPIKDFAELVKRIQHPEAQEKSRRKQQRSSNTKKEKIPSALSSTPLTQTTVSPTSSISENMTAYFWSLCQLNEKLHRNIRTLSDQLAFQIKANADIKKWVVTLNDVPESTQELILLYQDALVRIQHLQDEFGYWISLCEERQEFIEQTLLVGMNEIDKYLDEAEQDDFDILNQLGCPNCGNNDQLIEL